MNTDARRRPVGASPALRIGRLICAALATLSVWLAGAIPGATVPGAAAATVRGEGSTLVAPLVSEWSGAFEAATGDTVQYGDLGSTDGIQYATQGLVDFGATDTPMTTAQQLGCPSSQPDTCLMIPWALSATGIGYNIPGIGSGLHLDGPVLSNIFRGKITHWNNSTIKALNKSLNLPKLQIEPIAQSGLDGTATFSQYLSDVSSGWESCCGATDDFAFAVKTAGNAAAASTIKSTTGAIGYASGSYLLSNGVTTAEIENAAGNYEYPNPNAISAAAAGVHKVPAAGVSIVDPSSSAKIAYPISAFDYAIVAKHPIQDAGALKQWLSFCVTTGRSFGLTIDFAPIPSAVENAAKADINAIS